LKFINTGEKYHGKGNKRRSNISSDGGGRYHLVLGNEAIGIEVKLLIFTMHKLNVAAADPAASRRGMDLPPHENGTRTSDPPLSWMRMPFIPFAASCGVLSLKI
jgi:hypothetical protein